MDPQLVNLYVLMLKYGGMATNCTRVKGHYIIQIDAYHMGWDMDAFIRIPVRYEVHLWDKD